jgi:outer membrane lipoprotein-sorting protein
MKRKLIALAVSICLVSALVLSACAHKAAPTAPTTTTPTSDELSVVLGRAATIASVQYDMAVTAPGAGPVISKMWQKKNKTRIEMITSGMTVVYLVDYDAKMAYMYTPAQNMATKVDISTAPSPAPTNIGQYNPVVIGSESMQDKDCLVVEYTAAEIKTKSWIWKARGFPIHIEAIAPEGTSVIDFKNIAFVDIPDSMFELPAGVQIKEAP